MSYRGVTFVPSLSRVSRRKKKMKTKKTKGAKLATVATVKRMIATETELKNNDIYCAVNLRNYDDTTIKNFFYDMTEISQGDGEDERIGTEIQPKYLTINLHARWRGGTPVLNDWHLRCIVFKWHVVTTPVFTRTDNDILDTVGMAPNLYSMLTYCPTRSVKFAPEKKFTLIKDFTVNLPSVPAYTNIKKRIKLSGPCYYRSDILDTWANGHIGVLIIGDSMINSSAEDTEAGYMPLINGLLRLTYTD